MRIGFLLAVITSSLALGGCVASLAAGAIGAAARSGQQSRNVYYNDEVVRLAAATACRAQAAPHGIVSIIDIEQRSPTKATVWGTATSATERRSFECRFDRKVVSFKVQKI